MRTITTLAAAALLAAIAGETTPAHALIIDGVLDPLHGYCNAVSCADITSGGNTVTGNTTTGFDGTHFGFSVSSGPLTGSFYLVVAEPNNVAGVLPSVSGTIGVSPVSATGVSQGPWSPTGDLDAVPNIATLFPGASPTNPMSNFLPFTQQNQKAATGYNLYSVNLGTQTLPSPSGETAAAMDLSAANLPNGSMIFGFFDDRTCKTTGQGTTCTDNWIATASSGTLWDDGPNPPPPPPPVPEPSTLALLGAGLLGLGGLRRRR